MQNKADVTVILTVWKRDHIEEQLEALTNQTMPVKNIWVYQNQSHINVDRCLKQFLFIEKVDSTINLKYFGRFSLAQYSTSAYTWILDDDIIPSSDWVEMCIDTSNKYNAIISGAGRIILPGEYDGSNDYELSEAGIGDSNSLKPNFCDKDVVVDFGCNGWFFKTEWLKYFWRIWPFTLQNGEDIHLSATCKVFAKVPTIVPKQSSANVCGNLKQAYGLDKYASFNKKGFFEERVNIVKYLINDCGWEPIHIDHLNLT